MRNSLADFRWVAVLLVAAACPRQAQADPIVITGGSIGVPSPSSGFDFTGFRFTAEDSIFSGTNFAGGFSVPSQGGTVNLSGSLGLTDDFPSHHPVLEVVNGTSFQAFLTGGLTFTAEPFVVPPAANGPPGLLGSFFFSTPMTMTGNITGWGASPFSPGAPVLFSVDVTGTGTASVSGNIFGGSPSTYVERSVNYGFAPTPAPTPEPSTLLLLGSAVAGVFWRRARSRKTPPPSARTLRPSVNPAASS